jgi:DNA helicase HerA-like ATPase
LYLDEAHRFLHLHTPIDTMLSQARGYGLGMVLALQNLAQLGTRELREGVSANTLHKLFFRLSPEDATYAERHTHPLLTAHDLTHLDNYVAAARLHPGGIDRPAFTLRTRRLPDPITGPTGSTA